MLALGRSLKLIGLLQKVGHRLVYLGKVLNEAVVISCQPMKTPDISRIVGLFPFFYSFYLGGVNNDSLNSENVTQEDNFFKTKFTLAELGIQLILSQLLQHYS